MFSQIFNLIPAPKSHPNFEKKLCFFSNFQPNLRWSLNLETVSFVLEWPKILFSSLFFLTQTNFWEKSYICILQTILIFSKTFFSQKNITPVLNCTEQKVIFYYIAFVLFIFLTLHELLKEQELVIEFNYVQSSLYISILIST